MTTTERLERLRKQERQLIARREALEAKVNLDNQRRKVRQHIAIGAAVLGWMRTDEVARTGLPRKLRPFVADRDRAIAEDLFSMTAISAQSATDTAGQQEVEHG